MKKILAFVLIMISASSFAGLPEMMKVYNNPKSTPKIAACKGDIYCNGFIALSKQWPSIPKAYRYHGFDIRADAKSNISYDEQGRGIGLDNGFYFYKDRTQKFVEGADKYIETKGQTSDNHEGGLAVLLYIEDKNGWAKE